jgi:hypothetical protein
MGGRHGGRPSPIKVQAPASGDATVGDGDVRTTRKSSLPIKVQASASGDTTIRGDVRTTRRSSLPIKVGGIRDQQDHFILAQKLGALERSALSARPLLPIGEQHGLSTPLRRRSVPL